MERMCELSSSRLFTIWPFCKESGKWSTVKTGLSCLVLCVSNFHNVKSSSGMAMKRAKKQTTEAVDKKGKDFLTEGEMKRLLDAAKGGRYGARGQRILLMTYRHGLR